MAKMTFEEAKADAELKAKCIKRHRNSNYPIYGENLMAEIEFTKEDYEMIFQSNKNAATIINRFDKKCKSRFDCDYISQKKIKKMLKTDSMYEANFAMRVVAILQPSEFQIDCVRTPGGNKLYLVRKNSKIKSSY